MATFPIGGLPSPPSLTRLRTVLLPMLDIIEEAHLVPKEERRWYDDNYMRRYGSGLSDIDI